MIDLKVELRRYSLTRRLGWIRLCRGLGVALQAYVLGRLLFVALLAMYCLRFNPRVFRYMGF